MKLWGRPPHRGTAESSPAGAPRRQGVAEPRRRRRAFSTLTLRILAPNVLALGVLVGGIFYLDQYRDGLIDAKVASLQKQAEIMAGALGQSALTGPAENRHLNPTVAAALLQRLVQPARVRARLYAREGGLVADSRQLVSAGRQVQLRYLPPPVSSEGVMQLLEEAYDWLLPRLPRKTRFPPYREHADADANAFPEAEAALHGDIGGAVRSLEDGTLILNVAVPVQQLRQVVGALMLSADSLDIEEGVRNARLAILEAFAIALAVTVLLSLFLAGTIRRPLRRLAGAADRVRRWRSQRVQIPNLSRRRDEIGDLSAALRDMTRALYDRLDAIEVFAADVAHEIKNPISSLRSALETLERIEDPERRARLMAVMMEDVKRLDRLISDISNASRIDAEMARADTELLDLSELLRTVVAIHRERDRQPVRFELALPPGGGPVVEGISGRLGQVADNLIANAMSFSPPDGLIRLTLAARDGIAELSVEDDGPGIPEGREEAIFQRFYTQRPAGQRFGQHSGLGLSICRQIVEAHGGVIRAENRRRDDGTVAGARFVVRLPLR
ncbi:MAG TPA: sensor histidine kinase [Alphaproteobacteria bacterium]|nr:sensor histidine kinase [Alphaproteobacteria bacterium]